MDLNESKRKFGLNVKHFRLLRGYTQAVLSEKMGFSETYLSLIENGHKNISYNTIFKFSQVLNVDISKLFMFD